MMRAARKVWSACMMNKVWVLVWTFLDSMCFVDVV
jgi:hypothetical protein